MAFAMLQASVAEMSPLLTAVRRIWTESIATGAERWAPPSEVVGVVVVGGELSSQLLGKVDALSLAAIALGRILAGV